jgi:hypothetical protein
MVLTDTNRTEAAQVTAFDLKVVCINETKKTENTDVRNIT